MGYTVARPAGSTEWGIHDYLVRLQQKGVTLGHAPRVRDPLTGQRWLHHWEDRAAAEEHAAAMRKGYKDPSWRVVEVPGPADIGPLWPLVFQVTRGYGEVTIMPDSLTEQIIATVHPQAVPAVSFVMIQTPAWERYRQSKGGFNVWARDVMPALTGL
ncbi:MAG: hypothetical protein ACRC33_12610, partial [Gemmataceae bacterium]